MSAAQSGARMAREKRGRELSVRAKEGKTSLLSEQLEACSGEGKRPGADAIDLRDLYRLLEDYAPSWYTEEHHRRSKTGLGRAGEQGKVFLMLYDLLEEYAPPWYTSEFQTRAGLTARRLKSRKKAKKRPRKRHK
jgi:hypothetical protein